MLKLDNSDLLCLLEILTDAIDNDCFALTEDHSHAEDLLRRVKQELVVPHA